MESQNQFISKDHILCFKFYDPSNEREREKRLIKDGFPTPDTSILIRKIQNHI